jgi:hypothetical protein
MLNDEMKLFVLFCVFLLGAYITSATQTEKEGFTGGAMASDAETPTRCPNMLIQKGTSLFLYNTKLAPVPGVNPIRFENLEDYVEFMEWMRGQGIKCPILYLQHSLNTQGESIYSIRPGPTNLQGGLSANIAIAPPLFGSGLGRGGKDDDAATMFSPEQISEITRIIDQSGDNDPYNASTYPGGWSNTIIKPVDNASLMKIQSSYMRSETAGSSDNNNNNSGMKLDGYPGMAAAATAAATAQYGRNYDNSRDNEYTNDNYKVFDSYNLSNPNSYFNQISDTRQRQYAEREARLQKKKDADSTATNAAART